VFVANSGIDVWVLPACSEDADDDIAPLDAIDMEVKCLMTPTAYSRSMMATRQFATTRTWYLGATVVAAATMTTTSQEAMSVRPHICSPRIQALTSAYNPPVQMMTMAEMHCSARSAVSGPHSPKTWNPFDSLHLHGFQIHPHHPRRLRPRGWRGARSERR
jgi:hypothetical protein